MHCGMRHVLRSIAASHSWSEPQPIMPPSPIYEVEGIIQQVDPVCRELVVLVNGIATKFYVPLDAVIVLNDERVKLRLLQPMDHARLTQSEEQGVMVAHSITVHWAGCVTKPNTSSDPADAIRELTDRKE